MTDTHPFRKKWGQNFLKDPNTILKIVELLEPSKLDTVLEIGPGDGALTDIISKKTSHVHAVEIDPLLIKRLKEKKYNNVTIYETDILKWDISILPNKVKIISNLPYYISSPILFRFITNMQWDRMIFMFQKELAERIISKEGSKIYGRISVMAQVYCDIKAELSISKNVFQPKPEIDSIVLSFIPRHSILPRFNEFSNLIKQAFSQRRKKLKNNLSQITTEGVLNKWANMRPETISPEEFIKIYNMIYLG